MTDHPDEQAFADVLIGLLRARGLSQRRFAEAIGAHEGNVSRWCHGGGIELTTVWKIADYFGQDRNRLALLAGYPDNTDAPTKASTDPTLDALFDAERTVAHAELRDIPRPFHSAVINAGIEAGSLARRQAAELVRLTISGPNSTSEGGANSTPERKGRQKGRRGESGNAGRLTGFQHLVAAA
jgi:transcriptional regulator with XRE-family HTH domain